MEFSALVAKAQAKNMMSHFYGTNQGTDVLNSTTNFTFSYLNKISEAYSDQSGIGGERD